MTFPIISIDRFCRVENRVWSDSITYVKSSVVFESVALQFNVDDATHENDVFAWFKAFAMLAPDSSNVVVSISRCILKTVATGATVPRFLKDNSDVSTYSSTFIDADAMVKRAAASRSVVGDKTMKCIKKRKKLFLIICMYDR